ncbi:ATP-binding protein [Streptomyces sp. NPDC006997]|uniref:ATP-binding protein n=1 Tax=Streptomyces sp. NPDC006997 TaxID=3155356 RepID=UPI0033C996A3
MVIPLMKQAEDEQGDDRQPTPRCGAVWADGAARAGDARQTLRAFLGRALPASAPRPLRAGLAVDAILVVSELVTNAVRHAPGPCAMTLELSADDLTISVWDTSATAPTVNPRDPHRVGGHGLYLVHTVSDRVAVTVNGTGKWISARLRLAPAPDHHTRTVPPGSVPGTARPGTPLAGPRGVLSQSGTP